MGMTQQIEWLTEQLKQTQMRFRTLMEAIPVGLLIIGENGLIEGANPHSLTLFQAEYGDIMDKALAELFDAPPELNSVMAAPIEVAAKRPNGERFQADILIRPFADGPTNKYLVAVEDVTARHELAQAKQQFISMISHDLRDPLTSLQIFLSMTTEGSYDNRQEALKERAAATEQEVQRLIAMITHLLDIEKSESARLPLEFASVAISDMIESSLNAVQSSADRRGISLKTTGTIEGIRVRADADYIVQTMVNLLGNALKFSPDGKTVELSSDMIGSFVKITVTDQGPGIPEEFRQKIFNRYEQARMSDSRLKGGSGLGLSIAKNIVTEHGGTIGVDNNDGAGSSFWFTLPLSKKENG